MNHPNHEEWLPYLEGEASPEAARSLSEHLKACPQCAAEMAGRLRSVEMLRRLSWPKQRRAARGWLQPALKWGMAAAIVLGAGFAAGRLSSADARQIKAEVLTQVRGEFDQEVKAELLAAFDARARPGDENFQRQLLRQVLQVSAGEREQYRQTFARLLNLVEQKQTTDYLSMRRDLETLASTADDSLQLTRWQMNQLTGNPSEINEKQ